MKQAQSSAGRQAKIEKTGENRGLRIVVAAVLYFVKWKSNIFAPTLSSLIVDLSIASVGSLTTLRPIPGRLSKLLPELARLPSPTPLCSLVHTASM